MNEVILAEWGSVIVNSSSMPPCAEELHGDGAEGQGECVGERV